MLASGVLHDQQGPSNCYICGFVDSLIHPYIQFWNVKVVARRPALPSNDDNSLNPSEPPWVEEERRETATSLKDKQIRMEQQVYRIWT